MKFLVAADPNKLASLEVNSNVFSNEKDSEFTIKVVDKSENDSKIVQLVGLEDDVAILHDDGELRFVKSKTHISPKYTPVGIFSDVTKETVYRVNSNGIIEYIRGDSCISFPCDIGTTEIATAAFDGHDSFAFWGDKKGSVWKINSETHIITQIFKFSFDYGMVSSKSSPPLAFCGQNLVLGNGSGILTCINIESGSTHTLLISSGGTAMNNAVKCVTAINDHEVCAGTAGGAAFKLSTSNNRLRLLGKFSPVQGSIRFICERDGLIALGGVDRSVYVFDLQTRQIVSRVYTGWTLRSIAFISTDKEEELEADDDMWEVIDHNEAEESEWSGFDD